MKNLLTIFLSSLSVHSGQAIKVGSEAEALSSFQLRMKGSGSVRSALDEPEFGQPIFDALLQKDGELAHLLYSDIVALEQRIAMDFQDVVSIQSIGTSWQGRDINVLTLDAR